MSLSKASAKTIQGPQSGSSLIEVMVALFLLGIGLLGILAMQNNGQRSNQSALFYTQAMVLAEDMAGRISAADDPLDDSDDNSYDSLDTSTVTSSNAPSCSAGCSKAQLLKLDEAEWADAVSTSLPSGRGLVDYDEKIYTITLMWDDQLTGAAGTDCGGNPEVDLLCTTIQVSL